jgi:hypothetical protein
MTLSSYDPSAAVRSVRVFALLSWSGSVGLPTRPVGALAVDEASGSCRVAWMPLVYDAATDWRVRLSAAAGMDIRWLVEAWLEQTSTLGLAELPTSDGDLRVCAEAALEQLVTSSAG